MCRAPEGQRQKQRLGYRQCGLGGKRVADADAQREQRHPGREQGGRGQGEPGERQGRGGQQPGDEYQRYQPEDDKGEAVEEPTGEPGDGANREGAQVAVSRQRAVLGDAHTVAEQAHAHHREDSELGRCGGRGYRVLRERLGTTKNRIDRDGKRVVPITAIGIRTVSMNW